ncbi:MerR family transcriptional regulator [Pedobacter mucosus]|uniref:MerR family transcriptional regulator n=1 Tax=Pedobacter mucosus TaxID=2895286 RepID=UPI001EE3A34E|nr:MerR family transcriptional regulator [Pedobacter mucosus]UKT65327.1 MerR family transcriptional regulator [Pedobacter mucosus]
MVYNISDLEQLSGIQSHTIRIWERRYKALKPMRSKGNTRLYNDEQLVRLLNIATLNQSGLKISKVCSLTDTEVKDLVAKQQLNATGDQQIESSISQLIKHGIAFDETAFNLLLNDCIVKVGMIECYQNIIYPLLLRLGVMWRSNDICPAHEHFISNIIKQKIFAATDNLPLTDDKKSTWLLFLPEDEDHDIGLLFANFMLRLHHQKVVYLGSKVPLHSIEKVLNTLHVDNVLLFMVKSQSANHAQHFIDHLLRICSSKQVCLAGNGHVISSLKKIDHIKWFKTLDEFEKSILT